MNLLQNLNRAILDILNTLAASLNQIVATITETLASLGL